MQWNTLAPLARLAAFFLAGCGALLAQDAPTAESGPPSELEAAWQAAGPLAQRGPDTVILRDQAIMQLPEGYAFVPAQQGARIMNAMGNQTDARFMGLVVPMSDANWFVTVDFEESGYIKDDDAKEWDAEEMLDSLKEGTEASNAHRAQIGVPAIELTRWIEVPAYDAASHQLVWSAEVKLKEGDDPDPTINYNTYVLGREGYISMNLVTSTSTIDTDRQIAKDLLSAVNFNEGKRYADFDESTDKVAAYGLTALVGGLAAKKLGLLAVIGALFVKFAKFIVIGVVALGGLAAKFFRGRNEANS